MSDRDDDQWFEFGQWLRNDVPKYAGKPGMVAAAERAELAADIIDAVVAVHLNCTLDLCPTRQAILRAMTGTKEKA